jgi:aminoglycoside phosphotransferase (APT) family kinase protein
MPRTLVHGDFVPKNVRVRKARHGRELVAFDWETAGLAPPAADLVFLAKDTTWTREYQRRVASFWPAMSGADIDRLARVGTILRLIHGVCWESRSFRYLWIERAMRHMAAYEGHLREAVHDSWVAA